MQTAQVIKCCKDCTTRYVGCHAECAKYIEERAKYEELAYKDQQRRNAINEIVDMRIDRINKARKRHRRY